MTLYFCCRVARQDHLKSAILAQARSTLSSVACLEISPGVVETGTMFRSRETARAHSLWLFRGAQLKLGHTSRLQLKHNDNDNNAL